MQTKLRKPLSLLLALLMMAGVIAVAPVMASAAVAPTITTTSLPDGAVGVPYSVTLAATGDTPITWTLAVDGDPHWGGLTLNPDSGAITGTPTAAGTYAFTVVATNAAGSGVKDLSFVIGPNPAKPVITKNLPLMDVPLVKVGAVFTATLDIEAEIPNGDPIRYQWYRGTGGSLLATPISGATAPSYTVNEKGDGGRSPYFYCVVYNANDETLNASSIGVSVPFEPTLRARILKSLILVIDKILLFFGSSISLYDFLYNWIWIS